MRTAAAYARLFPVAACLLACPAALRAVGTEQDQFEEKAIARSVERAVRAIKSDRVLWVKELEEAFPGKVGNPVKDEEYGAWFRLLAGDADEWRRAGAPSKGLAELYDKVAQRLELGPVPSIKREEFLRYARRVLREGTPRTGDDANEDADRVFRVLDRDGDGTLAAEEWTSKLREDQLKADADANGRIDKNEYRESYQRRVAAAADAAAKAGDPKAAGAKTAAPDWFAGLDADKDGQVALHEWRKAGRPIELFMKMDLDGDGLLTQAEHARYAKLNTPAPTPSAKP
jgi:Ca2+-binding EF-hand superfamily protein